MNKEEIIEEIVNNIEEEINDKEFLTYGGRDEWVQYLTGIIDNIIEKENKNLQQELDKYKNNWNILKLIINEVIVTDNELYGTDLLNKMQELENK